MKAFGKDDQIQSGGSLPDIGKDMSGSWCCKKAATFKKNIFSPVGPRATPQNEFRVTANEKASPERF
jgi:hypothetical protein